MKLAIIAACAALTLAASPAAGQARVSVSFGVHAPPVSGHVVIGGPRHPHQTRVVVVRHGRYRAHRGAVVVVRPHRHAHGHGRGHGGGHRHGY